ncbi:heme ABC exporter ATP-binding protein CcmA [SAR86 cluster bacterium]|nr:heme ABC exporter ATP-binding protein CcmA [SAR86 cluster bacterium]
MLTIQGLSYAYSDRFLFKNLSFHLNSGEVIKISGANGSGKTTLIKILTGILKNYEGKISLKNEEEKSLKNLSDEIFYMGHKNALKENLTVQENLQHDFRLLNSNKNELDSYLEKLNLKEFLFTRVSELSEGQKRKIVLACCLASNSSIYLLDEPFINLDVDSQEIIMEALDSKIHNGAAVIFTSHDQNIKNSIELNLNDYKL